MRAGLPKCQEMQGEMGPRLRMESIFLTLSAFSGCFSRTSRKPGSIPESNTPLPLSWVSIPSCQKTSMRSIGVGVGEACMEGNKVFQFDERVEGLKIRIEVIKKNKK